MEASPAQILEAASTAGYDAAGLRLDPRSISLADATRLRRQADERGIQILDLEVVRLGPGRHADHQRRLLDLAETLGARFLLTVSEHQDDSATAADLAGLYAAARGYTTRIALEFMRFTGVPTLTAALDMLERADATDAVVLVDALHLHRGGELPEKLTDVPTQRIGYLQLCDAPMHAPPDLEALSWEARHDRLPPGEGDLPLVDLLARVHPTVPVSVEIQSDRLAARWEPAARASHLLASIRLLAASVERRRTTI